MKPCRWLLVFLLGFQAPGVAAEKPAADLPARFAELLKKLDDDEYQVRQDAAKLLAEMPGEAHALALEALARKNLGPEAKTRLTQALPVLALKARHLARAKEDAERLNWNKRTLREAYEKRGAKDPKWDADASEALDVTALLWSVIHLRPRRASPPLPSPAAPVTPVPMDLLNRAMHIVTPAKPFLDWLRYVDPNCQVTLDELRESGTAYLIPRFECLEDAAERLLSYYQMVFQQELWQWHRKTGGFY